MKAERRMDARERWDGLQPKVIAILRGIRPGEVAEVVSGLLEVGFRAIEVPLNSPDAFRSVELAVRAAEQLPAGSCLIGAGTVLTPEEVRRVKNSGGALVVSPNVDPRTIEATVEEGLLSAPGVFTASEALLALASGAHVLKFFPASVLGPRGIRAIQAVLPPATPVCAVGGVGLKDFPGYLAQGIRCFGIGSELYKPGFAAAEVTERGRAVLNALDAAAA